MTKTAAKRETTTTDPVEEEMQSFLNSQVAKSQFLAATANMGFRLAFTVVIPIVAGVKLDEHFHSEPAWTLGGLLLAAIAGCAAVWATVKQVNKQQADALAQPQPKQKIRRSKLD